MLSVQFPMLLAILGTVLMAIVIFAPAPPANALAAFAPPPLPAVLDRWAVAAEPFSSEPDAALRDEVPGAPRTDDAAPRTPAWPALVDGSAGACDADARLALVEALAAVRAPWAAQVLSRALHDEPDAGVRDAAAAALAGYDAGLA